MSSASPTLPSIRYAIETSAGEAPGKRPCPHSSATLPRPSCALPPVLTRPDDHELRPFRVAARHERAASLDHHVMTFTGAGDHSLLRCADRGQAPDLSLIH